MKMKRHQHTREHAPHATNPTPKTHQHTQCMHACMLSARTGRDGMGREGTYVPVALRVHVRDADLHALAGLEAAVHVARGEEAVHVGVVEADEGAVRLHGGHLAVEELLGVEVLEGAHVLVPRRRVPERVLPVVALLLLVVRVPLGAAALLLPPAAPGAARRRGRRLLHRLHRQRDLPLVRVHVEHAHRHLVAHLGDVVGVRHEGGRHLGDVHEAVRLGADVDEDAEVLDALHPALQLRAHCQLRQRRPLLARLLLAALLRRGLWWRWWWLVSVEANSKLFHREPAIQSHPSTPVSVSLSPRPRARPPPPPPRARPPPPPPPRSSTGARPRACCSALPMPKARAG